MRRGSLLIGLLVLGMTLGYVVRWNAPERRIERRLDRIDDLVSKSPGEGNLATAAKVRGLMEMFHEPFEFRADLFDFSTRDPRTVAGAVQRYRSGSERFSMRTSEREIDVGPAPGRATSLVVATFSRGLGDTPERYRFQVDWIEVDGEWKIERVDLVDSHPPR